MKIIEVRQRTEPWYQWRSEGIPASEISTILNRNPHKTRWRLWAELVGKVAREDLDRNPNVRRGKEKEDLVRQAFEARHDEILLPVCAESDKDPLFRCSLDGLTVTRQPVELKCPSLPQLQEIQEKGVGSEAYQLYYPQVQQQIFVTDATEGFLCFYSDEVDGEPVYIEFVIARDDALIQQMLTEGHAFWEMVRQRKEPEKDPARDILVPEGEAYGKWEVLADERKRMMRFLEHASAQVETLKKKLKSNEQGLVELMGEYARAESCGLRVTRFLKSGSVDYASLIGDLFPTLDPEIIEKYRRPGREEVRVFPVDASGEVAVREDKARVQHAIAAAQDVDDDEEGDARLYAW